MHSVIGSNCDMTSLRQIEISPTVRIDGFVNEMSALTRTLRADIGGEDIRHLRRIELIGWLCTIAGFATAWIAPNPLSAILLAQGMIARFFIGHHIGHGAYDRIPGLPKRYHSQRFACGWRRFVDWADWWNHDDWLYTHNQLHHRHTQSPLDADIMDSQLFVGLPRVARFALLVLFTVTWKFSYYAPRMRREHAMLQSGIPRTRPYDFVPADLLDLTDPVVRTLWTRDYLPYVTFRFALPVLLVWPFGPWVALSILANLVLAELIHNAQTFICIRPSHCAADIPLFRHAHADRGEFFLQSILGTVNYRHPGELGSFIQGWTNYQIEHHLWPSATLLQYKKARPVVQEICARHGVTYRAEPVLRRYAKTARLFMGLEHQSYLDTRPLMLANAGFAAETKQG
jgi:fatty acid desaturase